MAHSGFIFTTEASEIAQARLKGLDQTNTTQPPMRQHKDVNTFINNQLKFPSQPINNPIPPEQMKCNILKAKAEQQKYVNGMYSTLVPAHYTCIPTQYMYVLMVQHSLP